MSIYVTRENKVQQGGIEDFPEFDDNDVDSPIIFHWLVSLWYVVNALLFVNTLRSNLHKPLVRKHDYIDWMSDLQYSFAFGLIWGFFSEVLAIHWLRLFSY